MCAKKETADYKGRLLFGRETAAHPVRRNPLFPSTQGLLGGSACKAARLRVQYGGDVYPLESARAAGRRF